MHTKSSHSDGSCTVLKNRHTHFTVEVQVGTPPQNFDVVADTGSNNLIIASCICRRDSKCFPSSKCFQGTNWSSTFSMSPSIDTAVIVFGSGEIKAAVATDIARVGDVSTIMQNSLFLMVDHKLHVKGPFEGILGLGLPTHDSDAWQQAPAGFLDHAKVDRFSICFNSGADGVLQLNPAEEPNGLGSVGQLHWGLGFAGISVGAASSPVTFCSESSMHAGQKTPCGAIPDSGTTLMMGPAPHLMQLFHDLCDAWARCKRRADEVQLNMHDVFQVLLSECASSGMDIAELPSIHLHLSGAAGNHEVLEIPSTAYVMQVDRSSVHYFSKHLVSMPSGAWGHQDVEDKICVPAFGELDFETQRNGPVWILGLPLFNKFRVSYDRGASPPSMSFSNGACGTCEGAHEGIGISLYSGGTRRRQVHELRGPPRLPSLTLNRSVGL